MAMSLCSRPLEEKVFGAKGIKEIRGPDVSWIINIEDEVTMNDDSGKGVCKQGAQAISELPRETGRSVGSRNEEE